MPKPSTKQFASFCDFYEKSTREFSDAPVWLTLRFNGGKTRCKTVLYIYLQQQQSYYIFHVACWVIPDTALILRAVVRIDTDLGWVVRPLAIHVKLVLMLPLRKIHDGHKSVLTLADDRREAAALRARLVTTSHSSLPNHCDIQALLRFPEQVHRTTWWVHKQNRTLDRRWDPSPSNEGDFVRPVVEGSGQEDFLSVASPAEDCRPI